MYESVVMSQGHLGLLLNFRVFLKLRTLVGWGARDKLSPLPPPPPPLSAALPTSMANNLLTLEINNTVPV